jgi:hypothetical protein
VALPRGRWSGLGVAGAIGLGFVVRLMLGLRTPLDPSEATLGITALHIVHGQYVLMDPDGQYLGATDAYLVAPFIALFGTSLPAIRSAMAFTGALTVLAAWWFGRIAFRRSAHAVVGALAVAVFPLFAVSWSTRLSPGGADLLLLETICLSIAALIGWGRGRQKRWWALLGFAAGVALWSNLLFICVVVAIAVGLLVRAPRVGWSEVLTGAVVSLGGIAVGMLPWLVFNIPNGLFSMHAIPRPSVGIGTSVANLHDQLPILVGGASSCGHALIPNVVVDVGVAAFMLAMLWTRRRTVEYIVTGHWTGISQIDLALLVIPVTVALVVLGGLNADRCGPQHLIPMAVPLALGAVSILVDRVRGRAIAGGVAAVWLVVSAITSAGPMVDSRSFTTSGTGIPADLGPGLALLEHHHGAALWADVSLSRLLSYYSHDTLAIGEYGGGAGFLTRQQQVETALDPSWVFVAGDPAIAAFLRACATRSITYARSSAGGLVLYTDMTGSVEPSDVFSDAEARTS